MKLRPSNCWDTREVKTAVSSMAKWRMGNALVEFAIVLPFIALLVVGMLELARAMTLRQVLNGSAIKGCNTGIKANKTDVDMKNDVNNILNDNNIDPKSATITILVRDKAYDPLNPPRPFDKISIQVSVPASAVYWAGTLFVKGAVTSEIIVLMRQG